MFIQYKQLGCMFECRLKFAIISSGCIPWDYPVPGGMDEAKFDVCVANKNGSDTLASFQQVMDSEKSIRNCKCIPDCQEVKYEPQVCMYQMEKGNINLLLKYVPHILG